MILWIQKQVQTYWKICKAELPEINIHTMTIKPRAKIKRQNMSDSNIKTWSELCCGMMLENKTLLEISRIEYWKERSRHFKTTESFVSSSKTHRPFAFHPCEISKSTVFVLLRPLAEYLGISIHVLFLFELLRWTNLQNSPVWLWLIGRNCILFLCRIVFLSKPLRAHWITFHHSKQDNTNLAAKTAFTKHFHVLLCEADFFNEDMAVREMCLRCFSCILSNRHIRFTHVSKTSCIWW